MAPFDRQESPLAVTLKGVAAGLVGTLVMTTALQGVTRVLQVMRGPDSPAPPADAPVGPSQSAEQQITPTEMVAERLAGVVNARLSPQTRERLGLGIYWTYGAFWGFLSAQLQETLRPPALVYGAILGLVVWLIGPMRLVPALGLYERQAPASLVGRLLAVGLHLLYGWTTAYAYRELAGQRRSTFDFDLD
jgi:hypothetical protein